MTELDESIFDILKYGGGKIVLNDDELKLQIPRYNNTEDYSNMIKKNNYLKNKVRDIASLLKCNVSINADYRIDTLQFVVKMRKYANGIVESNYGFTYYILDKSKIDWMKIDNIFETLSQALEHKIIDKDAYNFIITKLHYRVDIGELNIK